MEKGTVENLYDDEPAPPSDRSVGFVFSGFFFILGGVLLFSGASAIWAYGVSAAFLAVALVRPGILAPMNRAWMKLGALLHRLTNPVVLGVLFFLVILPVGLMRRMLGADPMQLRRREGSFWIARPEGDAGVDMKEPF